jgi:hypothetical protein
VCQKSMMVWSGSQQVCMLACDQKSFLCEK